MPEIYAVLRLQTPQEMRHKSILNKESFRIARDFPDPVHEDFLVFTASKDDQMPVIVLQINDSAPAHFFVVNLPVIVSRLQKSLPRRVEPTLLRYRLIGLHLL